MQWMMACLIQVGYIYLLVIDVGHLIILIRYLGLCHLYMHSSKGISVTNDQQASIRMQTV